MTYDGFCAVALAGTFVMLIAVTVGWWVDHHAALRDAWREYRSRHADLRRVQARRVPITSLHAPVEPPMAGVPTMDLLERRDPSPRPRLTDYEYRAIAEGMEQT